MSTSVSLPRTPSQSLPMVASSDCTNEFALLSTDNLTVYSTTHSHSPTVGFQPNASATKVHHILIYGCSLPGKFLRDTPNYVWACGEMNNDSGAQQGAEPSPYEQSSVCGAGARQTILFGWALDAPAIELPPKVGFRIGGNSGISYLVLQVHYGNTQVFRTDPSITDNSGIHLHTVYGPDHGITRMAGIYLLLSYGFVPRGHSKHVMECLMSEEKVIHPFRFRTHTHKLGTKVAAYRKPVGNSMQMLLIGEHDPQQPQMFYPVEDASMTIQQGDRVYAYCDYNNTRDHTVFIGATGNDEMCNFYMMYWTEGELLSQQDCAQYNPR